MVFIGLAALLCAVYLFGNVPNVSEYGIVNGQPWETLAFATLGGFALVLGVWGFNHKHHC